MATIEGTSGSETLYNWSNYAEDDYIDGLGGNDIVYGQGGNDTLIGNHASTDWLYGGEGADQFVLYTSDDITVYVLDPWLNGQYTVSHVLDNISGTVHYLADYSATEDNLSLVNASQSSSIKIFDPIRGVFFGHDPWDIINSGNILISETNSIELGLV
jgi:hypothetical protein